MSEDASKPDRSLVIVLSIIAALVIIALVAVFARGEPQLRAASTPEGVVQRYAAAVIAGDDDEAVRYLVAAAREECEKFGRFDTSDMRVTLVSTTERGNSADVRVSIVTYYPDVFGSTEYQEEGVFELIGTGEEWAIERAPYQLDICQRF